MQTVNNDRYLDPPDEPEAIFCEDCGAEMEYRNTHGEEWHFCGNRFCPAKHDGIAKEMAILILEQQDTIDRLRMKLKVAVDTVSNKKEM